MAVTQISSFYDQHFLNHISLDCVVFGFHNNQLKVLLIRRKFTKEWALPGGFVREDESIEIAATRVLQERTGLDDIFLKQFKVFSEPERSKRNPIVQDLVDSGANPDLEWFNQRFISVSFYALVDFSKVEPSPDSISDLCSWKNLDEVDSLILDHCQILEKALETLRLQLNYQPIGFNLLPDKFTMPELQTLYETILEMQLDRRNFRKKILDTDLLIDHNQTMKGVAHKAAKFYSFDKKKYTELSERGFKFEI